MVGALRRSGCGRFVVAITGFLILALGGCAASPPSEPAQAGAAPYAVPNAVPPTEDDLIARPEDHRLGPTDVVDVTIVGLFQEGVETMLRREVSDAGYIDLPLLPGRITVNGLTAEGLRRDIAKAYEPNIVTKAAVSVRLAKSRVETFSILGAVARQGTYNILRSDMRLLEALALAGDVTQPDVQVIYVIRPVRRSETGGTPLKEDHVLAALPGPVTGSAESRPAAPAGQEPPLNRVIAIKYRSLVKGDRRMNIVIREDDVINVPSTDVGEFYVVGEVQRPGVYSLSGRNITVKMAIVAAGLTSNSPPTKGRLIRRLPREGGADEQIVPLDIKAILSGAASDIFLKPDDVICVGLVAKAFVTKPTTLPATQLPPGFTRW